MFKEDAKEAVPIATLILNTLLAVTPLRGRPGSDLRSAIGGFKANAQYLIQSDLSGPPLQDIFSKAQLAGVSAPQLDVVRGEAVAQNTISLGATLIKNALILYTLATECAIIATTTYVSRNDVDHARSIMNTAFGPMEEIVADDMDYATFRTLIELRAALSYYLVETARPLPRMLSFQFVYPSSSLYFAYRLYADAGRADELRKENGVVHPAFMRPQGVGLSS